MLVLGHECGQFYASDAGCQGCLLQQSLVGGSCGQGHARCAPGGDLLQFFIGWLLPDVRQGQVSGLIGLSALPAQPVPQFLAEFFLGSGLCGQIARHATDVLYGSQGTQGSCTCGLIRALFGGLFV
jgi:hypothetical protein